MSSSVKKKVTDDLPTQLATPTSQIALTKAREEAEAEEEHQQATEQASSTPPPSVPSGSNEATSSLGRSGTGTTSSKRPTSEDSKEPGPVQDGQSSSDIEKDSGQEADDEAMSKTSVKVSPYREELLDRYFQLQKDRRDLRRRNLQAQTNIAQYFRKHKLNPYPADPDKGQSVVREEYARLVQQIEVLATEKDRDLKNFEAKMSELAEDKTQLLAQLKNIIKEMDGLRLKAAKDSVHMTTGKSYPQKNLLDHSKEMDTLAKDIQPIRLKYAKLRRKLDKIRSDWQDMASNKEQGFDSVEILLENQIFGERSEQRTEELIQLEKKIETDVVSLSHLRMKHDEMTSATKGLEEDLGAKIKERNEIKTLVNRFKFNIKSKTDASKELETQLGLLKNEALLQDFLQTKSRIEQFEKSIMC